MDKSQVQQQIVDSLPNPSHGLLNIAPRVGKTKIAIDILIKESCGKVLWVTPSKKLRDSDIPQEILQWGSEELLKKVTIICYASLQNHAGGYDKIILDEYQSLTTKNAENFFSDWITYNSIIGLSGTHPKIPEKQGLYDLLKLPVISTMNIQEAVKQNLIADYKIQVVHVPLDSINKNVESGKIGSKFKQTEFEKYNHLTKMIETFTNKKLSAPKFYYLNRMRFIYNLPSKTTAAKVLLKRLVGRTLVFAGSITQAEQISSNTFHSKTTDENLKLFLNKKIDLLVCVNVGGVGFTFKDVDNFVIVQTNSDNKGDTTQKIARSLVLQDGYKANIYILCADKTVDETWVNKTLVNFNNNNVKHVKL